MNDPSDQTPVGNVNTGEAASSERGGGGSRRRFIKGGAAAAPVILTFTSRPVLGFEKACMTPSRMISGNHSGFRGPPSCLGTSLSTYQSLLSGSNPPPWSSDPFTGVFGSTNVYQSTSTGLQDQLGAIFLDSYLGNDKNVSNSAAQFAAYLIAAYRNASDGVGDVATVLTTAQVKHMWNDVIGTGKYCPQIAMCWNATGVIGYLQNSGIVPA